jgi:Protein of unknown function (DUF2793)
MSDQTPILGLPLIMPAQAQKHVTHNEALAALDAVVQLAVVSRGSGSPPGSPATGERHIVASPASGAWAGQEDSVALWDGGAWRFFAPQTGWRAWVGDETALVVWDGGGWGVPPLASGNLQNLDSLGINTSADTINRLALASAAALFSHAGADHRLKINKAAAGDTASLVFQSGFTGHAEIGLTGSTDLAFRVSADGASFADALTAEAATGEVGLPAGVKLGTGGALLDRFETGSWTPVLSFGGGTAGIAYADQAGSWQRLGDLVVARGRVKLSSKGTATGAAVLAGLPAAATGPGPQPGLLAVATGGASLGTPFCRVAASGTALALMTQNGAASAALTDANATDTLELAVAVSYFV